MQNRLEQLKELVVNLNIQKTDVELLDVALTHPSFNFEQSIEDGKDYERLEFLGDSVLRLVISEYLFDKYPDFQEGKLTKIRSYLVSDDFLYNIALKLNISPYLNIGVHEEKDGGRNKSSILACAMEAILGAIYKSVGFSAAKEFLYGIYDNLDIDINEILFIYNSKEILQQFTQSDSKSLPEYVLVSETGKAHDKTYEVCVVYKEKTLGSGIAKTKKEAEKIAAYNAIKELKISQE